MMVHDGKYFFELVMCVDVLLGVMWRKIENWWKIKFFMPQKREISVFFPGTKFGSSTFQNDSQKVWRLSNSIPLSILSYQEHFKVLIPWRLRDLVISLKNEGHWHLYERILAPSLQEGSEKIKKSSLCSHGYGSLTTMRIFMKCSVNSL